MTICISTSDQAGRCVTDDDQRDLIDGIRGFCDKRSPVQAARAFGAAGGFDRAAWRDLAGLGVLLAVTSVRSTTITHE